MLRKRAGLRPGKKNGSGNGAIFLTWGQRGQFRLDSSFFSALLHLGADELEVAVCLLTGGLVLVKGEQYQ